MSKTIIVDVSGNNAYETAEERINEYTNGIEPERIERIRAEVTIQDKETKTTDTTDTSSSIDTV